MCEQYSFTFSKEKINKQFGFKLNKALQKSYSFVPGDSVYVITNDEPGKLQQLQWGMVPSWAPNANIGSNLFNAQAEGLQSKPSFRISLRKRRCLILADGYYDWKRVGRTLLPYRITSRKSEVLVMAGLWDIWNEGTEQEIRSCAIITVAAEGFFTKISNRMPAFLTSRDEQKAWLEFEEYQAALRLLKPADEKLFKIYPITTNISKPGYNEADLHTEISGPPSLFD